MESSASQASRHSHKRASHAQPLKQTQSFIGLFITLLLVVYHYAVAEDVAPAAHRNQ